MATRKSRKRTASKAKRSNSNIQSAQREATQKRVARADREQSRRETGKQSPAAPKTITDPRTGRPVPGPSGVNRPGDPVGRGANLAAQGKSDGSFGKPKAPLPPARGLSEAANKIAGLATGLMEAKAVERRKLADVSLYGKPPKERAARLTELMNAADQAKRNQLAKAGSAVWMGPKIAKAKVRRPGPERMDPEGNRTGTTEEIGPVGDDVRSKDELLSWLADERTFNEIRKRANAAGIAVEKYEDVAKLWKSVVDQAAATFSTTGKKVTPWALMSLRGKTMKNGRPADRTTLSTSIEEMDPAQARMMFERSASEFLGRRATKEEIEDFIAKAQTIARANPNVTSTTTQYDFAGDPVSQTSVSRGGSDVVTAKAEAAAIDMAQQSEDYAAYQAAGVYMPWLTDALRAPV